MADEYYKKIFSDNLKYYMALHEKSQIDIVNDLHYDKSAVSTWVNGSRLPRMDKVDALAKYFGIKRSNLIEERVEPAAPSGSAPAAMPSPAGLSLSAVEEEIILKFRAADEFDQETVLRTLRIKREGYTSSQAG